MITKDTGGPAFPIPYPSGGENGMFLRDYFATHAPIPDASMSLEDHCMYRYAYADAMLKARKPKEPT
jgi:hypothetical protein